MGRMLSIACEICQKERYSRPRNWVPNFAMSEAPRPKPTERIDQREIDERRGRRQDHEKATLRG
jgi:hypothetical protein